MGETSVNINLTPGVEIENTPNEESEIMKCFSLLKQGEQLINVEQKDVTLVLGITGSGKSTLAQFLAGDNSKLIAKEVGVNVGEYLIEDNNDKISADSTIISKTILPEFYFDSESNTALYDCPGFSDTRGVAIDIAGTYFIRKILKNVKKIKILLVVNYSSVRKGGDRSDFTNLVRHTLNLIKNIDKYADSIALVATKVENTYKKKNNHTVLVSDEILVDYTAQFLKVFKENVEKVGNIEFAERAKRLIDILLSKSEYGYERIGIFRRPEETGPLSEMQLLQEGKAHIKKIITKHMKYTNVKEDDFGYAISDQSKNNIYEMVQEIQKNITGYVKKVGTEIRNYYEMEEINSTDVQKLYDEFHIVNEKISKLFDNGEKIFNLNEFISQLLSFVHELRINPTKHHISNILQQNKYLEFLEAVSQKKIMDLSWSRREGLIETRQYFADSEKWYNFLILVQDKLSSYNIHKNREHFIYLIEKEIIDKTDKNLKKFVDEYCLEIKFEDILKLEIDAIKLQTLTRLIRSSLSSSISSKYHKNSNTFEIRGNYIKLSDIDTTYLQKAKFINIFATTKVFIDKDLMNTGDGLHQISILAPTWEIIEKRKIILNGKDGCCIPSERATDGKYLGAKGLDGVPGLPGNPAGHFFGIGERFINGYNLEIFANGGNGSRGQDGGNGAPGYDGASPKSEEDIKQSRKTYEGGSLFWIYRYYCIYGESGGNGGNGGDGGIGGEGAPAGEITIISREEHTGIVSKNENGKDGRNGTAGSGGRGGIAAKSVEADKLLWWWDNISLWDKCSENDFLRNGQPGKNGTGQNKNGRLHAQTLPLSNRANILNDYKDFLRESLNTEMIQRAKRTEFLDQLNENSSASNLYSTLDLVKEYVDLENSFIKSRNNVDFLSVYHKLLHRVEAYAAQKIDFHTKKVQKCVLSTLYTAILSKIFIIMEKPLHKLITNKIKYLDLVASDIKEDLFMEDKYHKFYATEIKNLIEQSDGFIQKYIIVELNAISKLVQENVDLLVHQIVQAKKAESSHTYIENLHNELERNLIVMKLVQGPKKIVQLLNLALIKARELLNQTIPVNRYLILERDNLDKLSDRKIEKPSSMMTIESENEIRDLKKFLINITMELTNNSTGVLPIEVAKVKEYQKQIENIHDEKIYTFVKELKGLLDSIPDVYNKTEENVLLNAWGESPLLRMRSFMRICDVGIKDCIKINDKEKLNVLDHATKNANMYLSQSQIYLEKSDQFVTHLIKVIDTENIVNMMKDPVQLIVRSSINDLKFSLQKMWDGFILPESLTLITDRVEKGLNSVVNIYDHILYYQHLRHLAINIKNTRANQETETDIRDEELRNASSILNASVESNVLTALYEEVTNTLNKFIFPFGYSYSSAFYLDLSKGTNLKSTILNKIQNITSMFMTFETSVDGKYDEYVNGSNFVPENKMLGPFYTWKNEDYKKTISALLNGEEIILKADATKGISKFAIKFNVIDMKFKSSDKRVQEQLDKDLQDYSISLTHIGDSVYRCGNDFYVFNFEKQPIIYSFSRNEKGEPTTSNNVYDNVKHGDFILSPYTFWTVQLIGENFEKLRKYTHLVDIELDGHAQFLENIRFCNNTLKDYYQVDRTIFDKVVFEENQIDLRDIDQDIIKNADLLNNEHGRNRRSVNMRYTFKKFGEPNKYDGADVVTSKNNSVINWLVNNIQKILPTNSRFSFTSNATPISYNTNTDYSTIFSPNVQYDVNGSLLLTDLLVRAVTKAKPNYVHECAVNYEDVHYCVLNIITEFENTLESMSQYDGEFEFDPVALMTKLEKEIINGNRNNVGRILLDAVESKSQFNEDEFYHRLETFTGQKFEQV